MLDGERFVEGPFIAVSMQPETCGRMLVSATMRLSNGIEEARTRWLNQAEATDIGRLLARNNDLAMSRAALLLCEAEDV